MRADLPEVGPLGSADRQSVRAGNVVPTLERGGRRAVGKARMGPHVVVVLTPRLENLHGLAEGGKPMLR